MRYRPMRRIRAWLRSDAEIAGEIDEEIAFHLEMRAAKLESAGLDPEDARAQAEREFGDTGALRRALHRQDRRIQARHRTLGRLGDVARDVRFACRSLARAPGFALVALLTLVLGIGASVAMFTVVNAVLLRPLPYPEAEQLVRLWPDQNANMALARELGEGAPSLESWTGLALFGLTHAGDDGAALLTAQAIEAGFFDVFGTRPALGRPFTVEERDPTRSDVVLLSDALWRTRFGADPAVIGRRVPMEGTGHATREVVGVMPRGFVAPFADHVERVDVWIPLQVPPGRTVATDSTWFVNHIVGRMRAGATAAGVATEVSTLLTRVRAETGGLISEESVRAPGAMPILDALVADVRSTLRLLLWVVALVLLLACANLANLMLARGERRRPELAAKAALGGSRMRLVRELLTEGAVIAALGAVGGVLFARVILDGLRISEASGLPRMDALPIDARVLGFAVLAATLSLLLFALLPALRVTAGDLRPALGEARRTRGRTVASRRIGASLIAGEVALAMVVVTGAALLVQSFRTVRAVDAGMNVERVIAVQLQPSPAAYSSTRLREYYGELFERLRALPGVSGVGAIHLTPFTMSNWAFPYLAEGHSPPDNEPLPSANFRVVTPGYFEAVGMPLRAGRTFDERDASDAPAVGIINRTLAEQLWPGQDAVGRTIHLFGNTPFRVIGVVGDVHQHALDAAPRPEMYRPFEQWTLSGMTVMVAADADPAALAAQVRDVVASIDRGVPIVSLRPLADVLDDSLGGRRFVASVLSFFGVLALLLGVIGVYGVMTHAVSARRGEFSVRIALGATRRDVLGHALRGGIAPVLVGLAVGTLAALATGWLLESLLFGVQPGDPLVIAVAALVLGASALLAIWLPARRVASLDPASACQPSV
jgi:putative ABC transport system permease protein